MSSERARPCFAMAWDLKLLLYSCDWMGLVMLKKKICDGGHHHCKVNCFFFISPVVRDICFTHLDISPGCPITRTAAISRPRTITYHHSCHITHALNVTASNFDTGTLYVCKCPRFIIQRAYPLHMFIHKLEGSIGSRVSKNGRRVHLILELFERWENKYIAMLMM